MVKATRDAYLSEFRAYGEALTNETIELVQDPDGSLEPEAAAWVREQLEPNFEATAQGILNALQHDAASRPEGRVAHEQIHRTRIGLTRDLGISLDKATMRRSVTGAPQPERSDVSPEPPSTDRPSIIWRLLWWGAPLLGLVLPEVFEDAFAGVRSSGFLPLLQLLLVIWIVLLIVDSLPLPEFRRKLHKHRVISTLAIVIVSIGVVWALSRRPQSSPQQPLSTPGITQTPTAPHSPPQTAPPSTAAPQSTQAPAAAPNQKPPASEPRQPAGGDSAASSTKAMPGAAKCDAIGRFIESGRKLDTQCRASRCSNEREIEQWTATVRPFLKEHLTPREVIEFDNPPQQNWAVHGYPATGPKLKTLHDLHGRWNMLRDLLSRIDCTDK